MNHGFNSCKAYNHSPAVYIWVMNYYAVYIHSVALNYEWSAI